MDLPADIWFEIFTHVFAAARRTLYQCSDNSSKMQIFYDFYRSYYEVLSKYIIPFKKICKRSAAAVTTFKSIYLKNINDKLFIVKKALNKSNLDQGLFCIDLLVFSEKLLFSEGPLSFDNITKSLLEYRIKVVSEMILDGADSPICIEIHCTNITKYGMENRNFGVNLPIFKDENSFERIFDKNTNKPHHIKCENGRCHGIRFWWNQICSDKDHLEILHHSLINSIIPEARAAKVINIELYRPEILQKLLLE